MKAASPKLVFGLLMALAFTLATSTHLRALSRAEAGPSEGAFKKLLGDGRRLFSGQFVEMADVYLHSGMYPSIFDRRETKAPKAVTGKNEEDDHDDHEGHQHDEQGNCIPPGEHEGHEHDAEGNCVHPDEPQDEHEKAMAKGQPRDWLESFIRRFRITKHSHLAEGEAREILPWLKLAIELDPQAIETYTMTAYWLRNQLKNPEAAETVLREGIRNNPGNAEILFEMGRLYEVNYQDAKRARNIWHLALRRWAEQTTEAKEADMGLYGRITGNLAHLEAEAGNWQQAIHYFELAKAASPKPGGIQKQIDELQLKLSNPTNSVSPALPIP